MEVALTLKQFEDTIWEVVVGILGWDKSSPVKKNDVRLSWQNAPSIQKTDNVIYLKCNEKEDSYNKQRDVINVDNIYGLITQQTGYTRIMNVDFVVYGSDAFENVQTIKDGMFYSYARYLLANKNIYLLPASVTASVRVPELNNGLWWERRDFSLQFNELVIREPEVNPVDSAEVITRNNFDVVSDVTITSI